MSYTGHKLICGKDARYFYLKDVLFVLVIHFSSDSGGVDQMNLLVFSADLSQVESVSLAFFCCRLVETALKEEEEENLCVICDLQCCLL